MSSRVRVWYEEKRGHYVSNAAFLAAKEWDCSPQEAAAILCAYLKSLGLDWVEDVWAS